MSVTTVTADNWQEEVLSANGKVLVDLWGTGCAPCVTFAPVLESFEKNNDTIKVVKVNFDDAVDIAVQLGLKGLPTIYLFENGEKLKEHTGIMSEEELVAWAL